MRVSTGQPYPLGATIDAAGVNFALFSQHATGVELCLFDEPLAERESRRIALPVQANGVWHGHVAGLRAGQLYGYRVNGPFDPVGGERFNPNKLLLDPYARAISGTIAWDDRLLGYRIDAAESDTSFDSRDSAGCLPKCLVIGNSFEWGDDRPPRTPWSKTIIYECHVKGLSALHPKVPPELRGTYLGLASRPVVEHLQSLGVTAVELVPVQQCMTRQGLVAKGLTDCWGYNTVGFFAPDCRFASGAMGEQVTEFKQMVRSLHEAGIEVILDVVYNHSGEVDEFGPTICFRGIDNASYYRLEPQDRRRYQNFAGCGNCLNTLHPRVLQLIMDSLRYWVTEMHVDGFRFDLASVLARDAVGVDAAGRFYAALMQDPILSQVKLIGEPWDATAEGYRVGTLPAGWSEWNDKYRDTMRRFWRGDENQIGALAGRLSGSQDLFGAAGRGPTASINYVACHDGYTLRDLVSYEQKHNQANGEDNRDGHNENLSRNWGAEGATEDREINKLRERMQRNFLLTLACSLGAPMIQAGDEMGRSQGGNNNAYCHDDERTWMHWDGGDVQPELAAFLKHVLAIRSSWYAKSRDRFFDGRSLSDSSPKDVTWLTEHGREMTEADWRDPQRKLLGMMVYSPATDAPADAVANPQGRLLLLNSHDRMLPFVLPSALANGAWAEIANSARVEQNRHLVYGQAVEVAPRSCVLFEFQLA